jgi:hypothetical protein
MNLIESIIESAENQSSPLAASILRRGDDSARSLALRLRRQREANYIYQELRGLALRDLPNGAMPKISTSLTD